jgi:FixJ family two-component response regulator
MNPVVYVVDDDDAVRDSLATLLESVHIEARTCAGAREFFTLYDPLRPGCLVLDICMPGISGLELQEVLLVRGVSLPVIIVTGHGNVQAAVQSMKLGAVDFIEKPFPQDHLVACIRKALDSGKGPHSLSAQREEIMSRVGQLSPRELEVAKILITGSSSKVIARQLCISHRTVEVYRAKVMLKLRADSLCHLVRMMLLMEDRQAAADRSVFASGHASGRHLDIGPVAVKH